MVYRTFAQKLTILFVFTALPLLLFGQSTKQDIRFTSDPAISPDGQTVVFTYSNDLWQVSTSGGRAVRLTAMDGTETNANISPNGKWVAFTSNQYGNQDVYRMPLDGGKIKQLTYHQAADQVDSWGWDSKTIYFRSSRYNRTSAYSVSTSGETPKRLFGNYHNTVHNVIKDPNKPVYYFNESWESFVFPQRKRYQGPFNPDVKSYNADTQEFKKLTQWKGKDFWPTIDQDGQLYFVSDEANKEYNLYTLSDGEKKQLTNFDTSVRRPAVSANGSTIVFEKEYQLYSYDVDSGESQKIPITIYKNNTLSQHQGFNTARNISAFDVSEDQKKIAFVSRGELFVSDMKGKFVQEVPTRAMGRVLEVKWMSDSERLIFNQTTNGYQNWFVTDADGSGKAKQITDEHQNNRMMALNSDRSEAIYLSGRDKLVHMDLSSFDKNVIINDEFWGFQNQQPRFAPDDKHIVYSAKRNFEDDLFSYSLDSGETINLTNSGVSETAPFWSPDGKYIYFASSRTQPSYPRGAGKTNLYRMALTQTDKPYRSDKFKALFKEDKKDEKKPEDKDKSSQKEKPDITINKDGLMERMDQIGVRFGSQHNPFVIQKDKETTVLYLSNHDGGDTGLWKTTMHPFKETKTKKIKGTGYIRNIEQVGDDIYGLLKGTITKVNVQKAQTRKINIEHSFERNLRDEFDQMFDEVWANIQENYYNEKLNGIDWKAIRKRYRPYLPYVTSRDNFRRLVNDMLGELNSSHMGFTTSGPEAKEYYQTVTLATGIMFQKDHPYQIKSIVDDSPADVTSTNFKSGDQLIAINGQEVDHTKNRNSYFSSAEMKSEISLTFKRNGETYKSKLHPVSYYAIRTDLYNDWEDQRQQIVDDKTDKRVAYVHMKDMGGEALQDFMKEMISEGYQRDALILDLRYNTGGNVHDAVLQFLQQRPYLKWKYRGGDFAPQPNFAPSGEPIVLLINEQTLSDGEVTAAGFRELDLGTIVGTETYRWIIFTSGKGLVDGSFYRLPSWGTYTLDGKNLEQLGINPDIPVDNTFKDRLDHKDPQLKRAIEVIQKKLYPEK